MNIAKPMRKMIDAEEIFDTLIAVAQQQFGRVEIDKSRFSIKSESEYFDKKGHVCKRKFTAKNFCFSVSADVAKKALVYGDIIVSPKTDSTAVTKVTSYIEEVIKITSERIDFSYILEADELLDFDELFKVLEDVLGTGVCIKGYVADLEGDVRRCIHCKCADNKECRFSFIYSDNFRVLRLDGCTGFSPEEECGLISCIQKTDRIKRNEFGFFALGK